MPSKKKSFGQKLADSLIPNAKDTKERKMGKYITWAAIVLVAAGIVATTVFLTKDKDPIDTGNSSNTQNSSDSSDPGTGNDTPTGGDLPSVEDIDIATGILKDMMPLYQSNNDVVGQIKIPGTKLDYPVTQSDDNEFYLDKDINKKKDPFGLPFADYRATITQGLQSTNISIYGHAKDDGTFFDAVKEYKDVEYYKKNPIIEFDTIYGKGKYKIIGLFMENVSEGNKKMFAYHDFIDMSDDAHFNNFVANVKSRSYFTTDVDVVPTDKLITLSTCDTEINKTDFRVALVARKIRPGESETIDTAKAAANKEMVMPELWVSKKGKKNPYAK